MSVDVTVEDPGKLRALLDAGALLDVCTASGSLGTVGSVSAARRLEEGPSWQDVTLSRVIVKACAEVGATVEVVPISDDQGREWLAVSLVPQRVRQR